jgi:hypothetical protein
MDRLAMRKGCRQDRALHGLIHDSPASSFELFGVVRRQLYLVEKGRGRQAHASIDVTAGL